MTYIRNQWNRTQVQWAKKPSHGEDAYSSSRKASAREPPKKDAWNNWDAEEAVENQEACWQIPLKFEGANREEFRGVFEWDDSAAQAVYLSSGEPTLDDFLADCERYSAHIDWETRRSCNLPECAEVMTREEIKRKSKVNYARHENTRFGGPVIIGLPADRDGNDSAVPSIHLPLFAVPPATGWGDEGDVVAAPTRWDEGNRAPPVPAGWADEGNVGVHPASGLEEKKEWDPQNSFSGKDWFGHGKTGVQSPVIPVPAEVAVRPAASEGAAVTARRSRPPRWAEVAAMPVVLEPAGFATESQVSAWEDSTVETGVNPAVSRRESLGPVASGVEGFSHTPDLMNADWMLHPTFPNNPESYKHIVPSGWGDFPEESAPNPDVEMNPPRSTYDENLVAHALPGTGRSGDARAGGDSGCGNASFHHVKHRHGSSGFLKYNGPENWKLKKHESEPRNTSEPVYRRNPQRSGRSPIAKNLRVNQDSKPSRSRWDRAKTSVWHAACALSNEERTSLMNNAKNVIRT